MATTPLVELRAIRKAYPGVVAVNDVDLTVNAGEVVGLVGKNGAGKSSVIKILAGLSTPDSGEIRVDGTPVAMTGPQVANKLGLAFVHQELALVPALSVAENVYMGLGYPGVGLLNWHRLRRDTAAVLDRLDAGHLARRQVSTLSVAQQRLVMIGRALAQDARLVVLDEPTASLSEEETAHLFRVVRSLRTDGIGVVYVSHRLQEIFELTDRVVTMRDGRVVEDHPTSSLTQKTLVAGITGGVESAERVVSRLGARDRVPGEVVLATQGLTRRGTVEDVDLTVRRSEIVGLAGLVGAGRTELARLLFGADRASGGTISVDGVTVTMSSPRRAIRHGVVLLPEDRKALGNLTGQSIRQNLTLPNLRRHRRTPVLPVPSVRKEKASAESMIEQLSIATASAEKPVGQLSGGNQQKVVLGKWLLHGAEVFIFDEPTHGIDVQGKNDVYAVMEKLAEAGKGVLFISSEFNELTAVCDRVVVMREGRLVAELTGDGITEEAMLDHCYAHPGSTAAEIPA